MTLAFAKMHGLGNDFVVIDATEQPVTITPDRARLIADRHFGVGCDQILVVEPARDAGADFDYRILNADGSESGQCGNGARCFARFVRERGLTDKNRLTVDAAGGRLTIEALANHRYRVALGIPRFEPADVPLTGFDRNSSYTLTDVGNEAVTFTALSLGNPHAVIAVADIDTADVESIGRMFQQHAAFPEQVNVSFVQTLARDQIRMRVFERGAGQTLACGSAACAAVAAGIEQGALGRSVEVALPGGIAHVHWPDKTAPIELEGPADHVFDGTLII